MDTDIIDEIALSITKKYGFNYDEVRADVQILFEDEGMLNFYLNPPAMPLDQMRVILKEIAEAIVVKLDS
jgi:hypothetical protein